MGNQPGILERTGEKSTDSLTFEGMAVQYATGRSFLIRREGRKKIMGFREGVKTKSGVFEIHEWKQLMERLIERSGERKLYEQLLTWEREHNYTGNNIERLEMSALELHARRMFDNRRWRSYIPFNQRFRPEALKETELFRIVTLCCEKPGQATKEQLDAADQMNGQLCCPHCGRMTNYTLTDGVRPPR